MLPNYAQNTYKDSDVFLHNTIDPAQVVRKTPQNGACSADGRLSLFESKAKRRRQSLHHWRRQMLGAEVCCFSVGRALCIVMRFS